MLAPPERLVGAAWSLAETWSFAALTYANGYMRPLAIPGHFAASSDRIILPEGTHRVVRARASVSFPLTTPGFTSFDRPIVLAAVFCAQDAALAASISSGFRPGRIIATLPLVPGVETSCEVSHHVGLGEVLRCGIYSAVDPAETGADATWFCFGAHLELEALNAR
jgi:hypothetical protein